MPYALSCGLKCRRRSQGAAPGRRTAGGGRSKHDADRAGEQPEGNEISGSADRRGTRGHGNALPPPPAQMGQRKEEVEHGQGGEGIPVPDGLHPRPSGGDVEGSGGNFKSPTHILHHLPRLPTQISGGSRHRDHHPRGQSDTEASSLEGEGPVCGLPVPAQVV